MRACGKGRNKRARVSSFGSKALGWLCCEIVTFSILGLFQSYFLSALRLLFPSEIEGEKRWIDGNTVVVQTSVYYFENHLLPFGFGVLKDFLIALTRSQKQLRPK